MPTEEDVRRLLQQKTETKNLDYKLTCNWATASNDDKCEIIKDVLAMSNTQDGGQIVFGVDDKTFEFVGMGAAEYQSFDPTKVNDFVRRYADPPFACSVYKLAVDQKRTVVIEVPEFPEVPIICKTDANSTTDSRKLILKKGGLYVRTDKPSSELVSSAEEMRDIIGRASRKKRDELLRTIKDLINGEPAQPQDDAKQAYGEELNDAEKFFASSLPEEFSKQGHWEVSAYPSVYEKERIADQGVIGDLVRGSTVSLRGWSFPHTDVRTATNFEMGMQSFTNWERFCEVYRVYLSALFRWKGAYRENSVPGGKVLSFISTIYQMTEFLQFFKRFYSKVPEVNSLHIAIRLTDTRNRVLVSLDPTVELEGMYECGEPEINLELDLKSAQLQTEADAIARGLAKRVFRIFNWNDVQDDLIGFWQQKLLTRTY